MSFVFDIEADPSKANRAIDDVTKGLASIEKVAAKAGLAVDDIFEANNGWLVDAKGQFLAAGKGVESMSDALRREIKLLDQIRGPARELQFNMSAIKSLYDRGAISLAEYTRELAKYTEQANRAAKASATQAANTIGLPGGAKAAAPAAGGGGGLGVIGKLGGAYAAMSAGKEILELGDTYTNLENRLKMVATAQYPVNELMERTKQIAQNTRSDWATTAESYTRLRKATETMGVSTERALNMTELLSMAMQTSGATASEASAGTLQLMQAMRAGYLMGDEFRSVSENMPDIMDALSKSMNMPIGQLKKLGAEGKITTAQVVTAIESAEKAIRGNFAKSTATAAQQWVMFKNELVDAAGQFLKQTQLIPRLSAVLKELISFLKPVVKVVGDFVGAIFDIKDAIDGALDKLGPFGTAIKMAFSPIESAKVALSALGSVFSGPSLMEGFEAFKVKAWKEGTEEGRKFNAMMQVQLEIIRQIGMSAPSTAQALTNMMDPWSDKRNFLGRSVDQVTSLLGHANKVIEEQTKKWGENAKAAAAAAKAARNAAGAFGGGADRRIIERMFGVMNPELQPAGGEYTGAPDFEVDQDLAKVAAAFESVARPAQKYNLELSRISELQALVSDDVYSQMLGDLRQKYVELSPIEKYNQGLRELDELSIATTMSIEEYDRALSKLRQSYLQTSEYGRTFAGGLERGLRSVASEMTDIGGLVESAMKNAFSGIEDALVDLVTTGKASFRDLANSILADLTRIIIRQALVAGFGPSGLGILPGFAQGGAFRVGGAGGTDSQLVAFRASPNETVTVETPAQRRSRQEGGGGNGGQVVVRPIIVTDANQAIAAMDSRRGERMIVNAISKNQRMVRGHISKR